MAPPSLLNWNFDVRNCCLDLGRAVTGISRFGNLLSGSCTTSVRQRMLVREENPPRIHTRRHGNDECF
jgi:hypothetical protein